MPIRVLLVEDNPAHVVMVQEMLASVGDSAFDLEQAGRLSSGLERLGAGDVDAVLLDLCLPDSQGFDTFAKLHARSPDTPIVVLSGLNDKALALKTVQLAHRTSW